MDEPFILDGFNRVPRGFMGVPKIENHIRRNLHAKRFRIDAALERHLVDAAREMASGKDDIWAGMRRFAKAPFESVFVEFSAPRPVGDGTVSHNQTSALWVGGRCTLMSLSGSPPVLTLAPFEIIAREDGYMSESIFPAGKMLEKLGSGSFKEAQEECLQYAGIIEVLWVLMHQPGSVKFQEVKGRQKIVKGKLQPVRAHTILSIDLATRDVVKRIVANGSRGSGVREHEVRGTWVHLNYNRRCEHQWQRVERPDGKPERWSCPCCGTLRVWRKDHVRGDASRGNKFHTYEVKDSRLEKRT